MKPSQIIAWSAFIALFVFVAFVIPALVAGGTP
jgi:hypothetical protein